MFNVSGTKATKTEGLLQKATKVSRTGEALAYLVAEYFVIVSSLNFVEN